MAAHGLLCQLSFSYSWEKLQLGSAGPEHSIFTSTIKSSFLQVPLLTLLHFILWCHLMKSSPSCKNLTFFYIHVQISILLNPLLFLSSPKIKNEHGCFTAVRKGPANDHMHSNTFLYFTYSLSIIPYAPVTLKNLDSDYLCATKKTTF